MLRVGQAAQRLGLSRRQLERLVHRIKTMRALADHTVRPAQQTSRLGLPVQQVERLAQRYRENGPQGLISRQLIHRFIVYEYPDGRGELRADGRSLACERCDRRPQVDAAAIVENKRLGRLAGKLADPATA